MITKMAMFAVAGVMGAGLLSQTKVSSYFGSVFASLSSTVEESVPFEVELERIRYEVGRLSKDIQQAKSQLANENVAIRDLSTEIEVLKAELVEREDLIRARGEAIKKGEVKVRYLGRQATLDEAKEMLASDVERFKTQQKELQTHERGLAIHLRNRQTLERHVATLEKQQIEMNLAVKGLESDLKLLRLEESENRLQQDDTRLSDIKQSFKTLKRRIDVLREQESMDVSGGRQLQVDRDVDDILKDLDTPTRNTSKN